MVRLPIYPCDVIFRNDGFFSGRRLVIVKEGELANYCGDPVFGWLLRHVAPAWMDVFT